MELNTINVKVGNCEEILRSHKLNTYKVILDELYEKSEFFRDMVEAYDCMDEGTPKENVIGSIMYDLEKTV